MLDDKKEEVRKALNVAKVDKDAKHKRKRTDRLKVGPSVSKRPRVMSETPDIVISEVPVSCDQGVSSSTHHSNTKHLISFKSLRMSNNKEDKLGPKIKNTGASNSNLANGKTNNNSIKKFFKPIVGKASAANNSFYPPD